jgi:predicted RNA binding protein YcfA (HicA-like mRNA interferase family)
MKLPRDVSGARLCDVLCRHWGYSRVHQVGSHIILETSEPSHQRLAIPDHEDLRIGTFSSILRAVAGHKGVLREAILQSLR